MRLDGSVLVLGCYGGEGREGGVRAWGGVVDLGSRTQIYVTRVVATG